MHKLTTIHIDGSVTTQDVAKVKLDDLQRIVGGYIELIPQFPAWEGKRCRAYCNEEGLLKGMLVNQRATQHWRSVRPHRDTLVGPVVIETKL